MNHKKLTIKYDGSSYSGWQVQAQGEKTIQSEIIRAGERISKNSVRVLGAGRTDSGVHALGQVAKLSWTLDLDNNSALKALNSNLPKDIRIIKAEDSNEEFHPIYHAVKKEYLYFYKVNPYGDPFLKDLITFLKFEPNQEAMLQALKLFEGEHDFQNFRTLGTDVKSTVRTIYAAELSEVEFSPFGVNAMCFKFVGSGFLKQMVRLMVGAMWQVGVGKVDLESLKEKSISPLSLNGLRVLPQNI